MRMPTKRMEFVKPLSDNVRYGVDGTQYFVSKPLSAEQDQMIRTMVSMGATERQIAAAFGRSHSGIQKILKRLGLKTTHKAGLEKKKRDAAWAVQDELTAGRKSYHGQ